MRDPAVLAVFALRITAAEHAAILAGLPIVRPFWPPMGCRGSVVGLHVAGEVLGEALLSCAAAAPGGCAWSFGPVTTYARRLPHPVPRGNASARLGGLHVASPHGDAPPRPDLAAAQHRRPVL